MFKVLLHSHRLFQIKIKTANYDNVRILTFDLILNNLLIYLNIYISDYLETLDQSTICPGITAIFFFTFLSQNSLSLLAV